MKIKGCKIRYCERSISSCSSSSSSSSCSSSSSSSSSSDSSCSNICKEKNKCIKNLNAYKAKFTTLNGTNLSVTGQSYVTNKFSLQYNVSNSIPTLISTTIGIGIPADFSSLSSMYVITDDNLSKTITFGKFTSNYNGIRLIFSNGTLLNFANTNTFAVTSNDTIVTGGGVNNIPALAIGSSVEYIGVWNSSISSMSFYKVS